jgi:hypothetical protein
VGFALNRTITNLIESQFDNQLDYILTAMIASAETFRTAKSTSTALWATSGSWNRIPAYTGRSAGRASNRTLA